MFTAHLRGISHIQGSWVLVREFVLGYGKVLDVAGVVVAGDISILTVAGDDSCTCGRTGGRGAGYCRCC